MAISVENWEEPTDLHSALLSAWIKKAQTAIRNRLAHLMVGETRMGRATDEETYLLAETVKKVLRGHQDTQHIPYLGKDEAIGDSGAALNG